VTASKTDVVRVPTTAITTSGTIHTVRVVKNGVTTTTPVQVGIAGGGYTEVTSGLTAGQVLAQTTTTTSSSGTTGNFGGTSGIGGTVGRP
jgi:hypothetical protein